MDIKVYVVDDEVVIRSFFFVCRWLYTVWLAAVCLLAFYMDNSRLQPVTHTTRDDMGLVL